MQLIKFKTKEYEMKDAETPNDKQLKVVIKGVTDYSTFRADLTKYELTEVKMYTGETLTADYGKFDKIVYPIGIADQEDGTVEITLLLEREDEITARISALEDTVDTIILSELGAL